jgi:hypothetical protein
VDVCVECAETLKNLNYISNIYKINNSRLNLSWFHRSFNRLKFNPNGENGHSERIVESKNWRKLYGVFELGDLKIVLTSWNTDPYVRFRVGEESEDRCADNVFSAWSKISEICRDPKIIP